MAAAKKMDELLVTWLSNDATYENIMDLMETFKAVAATETQQLAESSHSKDAADPSFSHEANAPSSPRGVIPPFYPTSPTHGPRRRRRTPPPPYETWEAPFTPDQLLAAATQAGGLDRMSMDPSRSMDDMANSAAAAGSLMCVRDMVRAVFQDLGLDPPLTSPASVSNGDGEPSLQDSVTRKYLLPEHFVRVTKDICRFPSFFNAPLYQRIIDLWNAQHAHQAPMEIVTYEMLEWFYQTEMEPYDMVDRFFRLVKQPKHNYIERNDFLPFIKALLSDHPGLEFLSTHAEFQEKYAITVITRIFYAVNTCHSGRITSRQVRRSDLLEAFQQVDEEEDINKVTRYLSYEHFYVLYCRFWELDHDRDYRISKDDLLKYGDQSLSHMIVDRIFDAAPRPFETEPSNREYMTYESFIYFM